MEKKNPSEVVSELGSRLLQLSRPEKDSLVKLLREIANTLSQIDQPLATNKKKGLKRLEAELKTSETVHFKDDTRCSRGEHTSSLSHESLGQQEILGRETESFGSRNCVPEPTHTFPKANAQKQITTTKQHNKMLPTKLNRLDANSTKRKMVSGEASVSEVTHTSDNNIIEKDGELERIKTEMSELHKSKRQLMELLEKIKLWMHMKLKTKN